MSKGWDLDRWLGETLKRIGYQLFEDVGYVRGMREIITCWRVLGVY